MNVESGGCGSRLVSAVRSGVIRFRFRGVHPGRWCIPLVSSVDVAGAYPRGSRMFLPANCPAPSPVFPLCRSSGTHPFGAIFEGARGDYRTGGSPPVKTM